MTRKTLLQKCINLLKKRGPLSSQKLRELLNYSYTAHKIGCVLRRESNRPANRVEKVDKVNYEGESIDESDKHDRYTYTEYRFVSEKEDREKYV